MSDDNDRIDDNDVVDQCDDPAFPIDSYVDTPSDDDSKYVDFRNRMFGLFSDAVSSMNTIIDVVTKSFIETFINMDAPPSPGVIEVELLMATNTAIRAQNTVIKQAGGQAADMLRILNRLQPSQIAEIAVHRHRVRVVQLTEHSMREDSNPIGIYIDDPLSPKYGIYDISESTVERILRVYNRELTVTTIKDINGMIRSFAPMVSRLTHPDLIAVGNGIVNYSTEDVTIDTPSGSLMFPAKQLSDFTPECVFTSKSPVFYRTPEQLRSHRGTPAHPIRHASQEPHDGYVWDVESWVSELSDDPGVPELLWQVMGAVIRPHVSWNKAAFFYSQKGNNGKGTLTALMRQLTGPTGYASIPISDLGKDFMLEPLTQASAIIVDENDVGAFMERAANFKTIVTHDVLLINRKYKNPIAYQFYGFMVQCLNELPRMKDKSGSLYRRQIFIPFNKSFTGQERTYIKDEFLRDPEVLEYVLWRVLSGQKFNENNEIIPTDSGETFYALDEPQAVVDVLAEYKEFNDPVREFWTEFEDAFAWDILPFAFLWDLYRAWYSRVNPNGRISSRKVFLMELTSVVDESMVFHRPAQDKFKSAGRMDATEPLIADYELTDWMGKPEARDVAIKCDFVKKESYRGLIRTAAIE